MRKITITFMLLLILATVGALVFVGLSPDFVEPIKCNDQTELTADNPVWDKSIDELAEYLVAQGVLPSAEYAPQLSTRTMRSSYRIFAALENL